MKNIYLLFISFFIYQSSYAQISEAGTPASFNTNTSNYRLSNTPQIPHKEFPVMDTSELSTILQKAKTNSKVHRTEFYSYIKKISVDVLAEGTSSIQGGVKICQYSIKAQDAKGIQLYFSAFKIPENAKLYVYNKDRSMILGAYTDANNTDGNSYTLQPILGDDITIELNIPLNASAPILQIEEIGYLFKSSVERSGIYSFTGSLPCENDVASGWGYGWEKEIRSVACVLAPYTLDNGFVLGGVCSGALLNNTFQDGKPYFLTADHGVTDALSKTKDPSKIVFAFNYQNTASGIDSPLSTTQTISGCTILTRESKMTSSDYALLLLNETPPASYNVCYAGWDYSEAGATYSNINVGIHHPRGDVKKISNFWDTPVSEAADEAGPDPNFWRVTWTNGLTEYGSSGSPLFNTNHRLIGQLYGGYSECDITGPDWYGKFSNSWMDGYFAYFLRPVSSTFSTVDTYCPVYNTICSNGIKDPNEIGIDCGGSCPPCAPTCTDGIQNGGESRIDCGGPCAACPPTCSDYIRNQDEIQTDCGGPNCPACVVATCTDHIQNQTETGIDCGGVCGPCSNFCHDGILNGDEIEIDCGGSCMPCQGLITTDAVTNGNFENLNCTPDPIYPYMSFGFNSDNKCVAGSWYASHGLPRIENWNNETPINHSLVMPAYVYTQYNSDLRAGIFYQLPTNLDPTAEYKLHFKIRYDGNPMVHNLEINVANGLRQSISAPFTFSYPVSPVIAAQYTEPTYPYEKYRINQVTSSVYTDNRKTPWFNYNFTFTVPTGNFNQIWITARNMANTGSWSLAYLDDFILTVSQPGTQPLNCSQDITFTNQLPSFSKAQNSITAGNSVNIVANQTVVLRAGNSVHLTAGFHASAGCDFTAKIGTCSEPDNIVTRSNNNYPSSSSTNYYSSAGDSPHLFQGRNNQMPKQLNNKITVSPNPTQGKFTIKLENGSIDHIKILNLYGASVFTEDYTDTSEVSIDLSNQNSSTYIIQILSEGNIYSEKIIVVQ